MTRLLTAGAAALLFTACGAHLDASGYSNPLGYRIAGGEASIPAGHFFSADWRIERRPKLDLYLHHVRDNGILWVQTLEVPENLEQTEPRTLLQTFAQVVADGHWWFDFEERAPWQRPWTVSILDQTEAVVAEQPGHLALLHVAEAPTWNSGARRETRATVVVLRPNLHVPRAVGEGSIPRPVIMIIGYANAPTEFERSLPDFRRLLDSIVFDSGDDSARQTTGDES